MSSSLSRYFILVARLVVGGVFVLSAVGKLTHTEAFIRAVQAYAIIPDFALRPLGQAFPWLELLVGVFLLGGLFTQLSAGVAAAMMVFFIGLMGTALAQGKSIDCGCFVGIIEETVSPITLIRDTVMLLLCLPVALFQAHWLSLDDYLARVGASLHRTAGIVAFLALVAVGGGIGINAFSQWHTSGAGPAGTPTALPATSPGFTIGRPVGGWRLGPERAQVEIVVYSDFQCSGCRTVDGILKRLVAEYKGAVAVVHRHYPLRQHEYAQAAAEAAEAAGEQGKFWEMHDSIFANQDRMSPADLRVQAQLLGLDLSRYDASLASGRPRETVLADRAEGKRIGVEYTPWIVVGDEVVHQHSYEALKAAIERKWGS